MSEILTGTIASAVQLQGSITEKENMSGSFDLFELPENQYSGVYIFTPSESEQTVLTASKTLLSDIVIQSIPSEYITPSGTSEITSNGIFDVTQYASASVDVQPSLQSKSATASSAGDVVLTADESYYGMSEATVTVPSGSATQGTLFGYTSSGTRWRVKGYNSVTTSGWFDEGQQQGNYVSFYAVPTGTSVTPSTSSQTVGGSDYMMQGAVTVNPIPSEYIVPSGVLPISSNGTVDVTQYASASVSVPIPSGYIKPSGTLSVSSNGTVDVTQYASASVSVDTEFVVTVTWNGTQGKWIPNKTFAEISAAESSGKSIVVGLSLPPDNAIGTMIWAGDDERLFIIRTYDSNTYIMSEIRFTLDSNDNVSFPTVSEHYDTSDADATSSDVLSGKIFYNASGYQTGSIATKSASDITQNGKNITAPSGYYPSNATYSMAEAQGVLSTSVNGSGLITATYTFTGAGYQASGSTSKTTQLTSQAAQTFYPSTADQTIAASRYTTGTQTFKSVSTTNLTADNIKNGVTVQVGDSADSDRIASVTGTYEGGGSGKNIQMSIARMEINASAFTNTGLTLTVAKAGTYKCHWAMDRNTTSGSNATKLWVNGASAGASHSTWTHNGATCTETLTLAQSATVSVYARARNTSYYVGVSNLIIEEQ